MFGFWPIAVLSARYRRRRPSQRVGLPWVAAFSAWGVMARLAVHDKTFDSSWAYWLLVGIVIVPVAVVLASLLAGVWPQRGAVGACIAASAAGTVISVLLLHASREPFTFAILGGMVVALLSTGSYVLTTATGETARRDMDDP